MTQEDELESARRAFIEKHRAAIDMLLDRKGQPEKAGGRLDASSKRLLELARSPTPKPSKHLSIAALTAPSWSD